MPDLMIAQRHPAHLDRVVDALRLVHETDRYPMVWPDDPAAWLTPAGTQVTGLAGVSRLFVAPKARATGVASALLEKVEDASARRGRRLALDVLADDGPAVRLYERHGWVRVTTAEATWTTPNGAHPQVSAYLSPR